ncbi:MAG: hypothetical protein ACI90V_005866, partial [Bacillariaceae sp.]
PTTTILLALLRALFFPRVMMISVVDAREWFVG